jgi:uncharacterized membrane-anchored protein
MQRQQLRNLQSNKLVQWGMLFLVGGVAVQLVIMLARVLSHFTGWAIFAGIVLIVVGLIRKK